MKDMQLTGARRENQTTKTSNVIHFNHDTRLLNKVTMAKDVRPNQGQAERSG
jgi:hypothetical protein